MYFDRDYNDRTAPDAIEKEEDVGDGGGSDRGCGSSANSSDALAVPGLVPAFSDASTLDSLIAIIVSFEDRVVSGWAENSPVALAYMKKSPIQDKAAKKKYWTDKLSRAVDCGLVVAGRMRNIDKVVVPLPEILPGMKGMFAPQQYLRVVFEVHDSEYQAVLNEYKLR